jgi:hypothetical protein
MHAPSDDWTGLDSELKNLAASGVIEVWEDGEWLSELAGLQFEIHLKAKNPLIHLWSDERNLTRRLVRIKEQTSDKVVLEVQRFGKKRPVQLVFIRKDGARSPNLVTREQFRARFGRILAEQFPDAIVDLLTGSRDLARSFSGLYVRGTMHQGTRAWALMAAGPHERDHVEDMLAFAILWLDWSRNNSAKRGVEGLRLFVPEGTGRPLRERALALASSAKLEVFEMREADGLVQKTDAADVGNLKSSLVRRSEFEAITASASEILERIREMLPQDSDVITQRVSVERGEVGFCFRGIEFARRTREGALFGLGRNIQRLNAENEPKLRRLLHDLSIYRNSLAAETNHKLYRSGAERWLESLVQEDPTKLDAFLDPKHFYSQVPALAAGDRGVLDLLGVTRQGRLVVVELKASEDIQLPLQAVDYWLRVRRHQREGDFQRRGYFLGIELSPKPPLVWLVAPAFQFHSTTEILLKYLSPEIQVTRIGINENWRSGIKVVLRQ